jgi:hypothetical protein
MCHDDFQRPLTIICQFANYLDSLHPNVLVLVFKVPNERRNRAPESFTTFGFVFRVSCAAMPLTATHHDLPIRQLA